ncbi:hypothetical protein GCM10010503_67400 [Streptomyces lucensis JCM 4490]|uniref:Uncharacterized protein n=1 Tax=Streptomyces lucensis JCM 4490 TaxID=1306176 RepID=A0A918MW97_9ACTN|nr:hypothetical protein GCM10010503_67400 [Streptomyces lucensis JCM 4490]
MGASNGKEGTERPGTPGASRSGLNSQEPGRRGIRRTPAGDGDRTLPPAVRAGAAVRAADRNHTSERKPAAPLQLPEGTDFPPLGLKPRTRPDSVNSRPRHRVPGIPMLMRYLPVSRCAEFFSLPEGRYPVLGLPAVCVRI